MFAGLRIAGAVLLLWTSIQPAAVAVASAQSSSPVDEGAALYQQSKFDEAIALLRAGIDAGALGTAELQRAREIIARSYVKKDEPARARETFRVMLRANPDYRPDAMRVPPDEVAVFEAALREHRAGAPMPAPTNAPVPPPAATPARPQPAAIVGSAPATKSRGSRWWLWAIGAVVAGSAVAVAAAAGSGDEDAAPSSGTTLREPPPPPPP